MHRLGWLVVVLGWMVVSAGCASTRGGGPIARGKPGVWDRVARTSGSPAKPGAKPLAGQAEEIPVSGPFTIPPRLRHQVDFWVDIFSRYSERQVVIHDTERLDRVYSVLDFSNLRQLGMSDAEAEQHIATTVEQEKARIRIALRHLDERDGQPSSAEERRIADLFRDVANRHKFERAAADDRVRAQRGMRERFARGIEIAHRYLPEMEQIFRDAKVPEEITRLPLVESCFNVHAYSSKAAAGIWQFIPSTGRLYMRIDSVVDERRDPLIASRAAARFLRQNYDQLGAWPLAITAYNHGPGGVARAVRETGSTDLADIIERYDGPAFKFASRNFYTEFLAALQVEKNHERYFGPLDLEAPMRVDRVRAPDYVGIETVASCAGVVPEMIVGLNPSLSREVLRGKQRIPPGYAIALPAGTQAVFEQNYAALPRAKKSDQQKPLYVVHKVQRGQTLTAIARRYGSTVDEIRRCNNLRSGKGIQMGQRLRIPVS
jgi:membrane-bound lytic murein transglycosylase D